VRSFADARCCTEPSNVERYCRTHELLNRITTRRNFFIDRQLCHPLATARHRAVGSQYVATWKRLAGAIL